MCLLALAAALMLPMGALAQETSAGWNDEGTVYTVVGKDGWWDNQQQVLLDHSCTVDLSQADTPDKNRYNNFYAPFKITGEKTEVTFVTGKEPLNLGNLALFYVAQDCLNPTVVLDGVNLTSTESTYHQYSYNGEGTTVLTIRYKGECFYPSLALSGKEEKVTFRFKPADENSVLNIRKTYANWGINAGAGERVTVELIGGKIVTDGNVNVQGSNTYKEGFDGALLIEGCDLTCASIYARELTIDGATVKTTSESESTGIRGGKTYSNYPAKGFLKIINGSTVTCAATVGGKRVYDSELEKSGIRVEITGSNVTCAAVGDAATITITKSTVNATESHSDTAAIGGYFRELYIENSTISAHATGEKTSAIGAGRFESYYYSGETDAYTITLKNSKVTATATKGNAIGSSYYESIGKNGQQCKQATIIIDGGDVTATAVNAPAIGAMSGLTSTDPDAVIIQPGTGGGWESGGTSGDASTQSLRTFLAAPRAAAVVNSRADAPASLEPRQTYWGSATLVIRNNPTVVAESGTIAINAATVTIDGSTTLFQNTLETAPVQDTVVNVGGTAVGSMRRGFRSLAVTAPGLTAGTASMTYGTGSDPDPLVNWHDEEPLYGSSFALTANAFNSFWTLPQQRLSGSARVSSGSATTSPIVTTSETRKTLYANIQQVTPSDVRATGKTATLAYQWYKDGQPITGATQSSYTPTEAGVYTYVLTGSDRYRGTLSSAAVTVLAAGDTAPDAPELDSVTTDTIVLKAPTDGKTYEYSIDGGQTWQDGLTFANLTPNTTYNIVRREKDGSGQVSAPLTARTPGDRPDGQILLDAIDYEQECFVAARLPSDVQLYTNAACTKLLNDPANGGSLTPYIAAFGETPQMLCARFAGETGTDADAVTAVIIPARPQTPVISRADVTFGAAALTVVGTADVAYNYAKGQDSPLASTAVTCATDGQLITFSGLDSQTTYRIYARVPASNEAKRFHSEQIYFEGATLAAGVLTTTVLAPAGMAAEQSYDLATVIERLGLTGYTLPETLSSSETEIVSAAYGDGSTLRLTPTGKAGTAALTGTNASITLEVLSNVVGEANGALWQWSMTDATGWVAEIEKILAPSENLMGTTGAGRILTARERVGGASVAPNTQQTVTVPYWDGTGKDTAYALFRREADGSFTRVEIERLDGGIRFTGSAGASYFLTTLNGRTYSVTLHPNGGTIAAGKDVTAYTYGVGAALPTAADVTRDLYAFAGWYDNEALTGDPVAAITSTDAGNKEYWAKWNLIPGDLPVFTEPSGPKEVTVQPGAQATLTASATGATVCQWYVNRGDGAGYVKLSGATDMTYTTSPVTLENDGYTYYCEATNLYGTARSEVFTLRVREPAVPPQTGDHSHTGLWVALMLLSLGGLGALGLGRRRQSGKR